MMLTLGKSQFWLRRMPKVPFRERYDGSNGKVAESKSYLEFGYEESYQLKTWYWGIGRWVLTHMKFEPDFVPLWMPLPGVVRQQPPPPPPKGLSLVRGPQ